MTKTTSKLVLEFTDIMMVVYSKDIFPKIKQKVGEFLNIQKETYIKDILKIIKLTVMENIIMKMVLNILDIGMMIFNVELDMKFGEIIQDIQENFLKEKNTV